MSTLRSRVIVLALVVAILIPTAVFAAAYEWKEGYAVGHGRGTSQAWYADLNGVRKTYSSVSRRVGDGIASTSDSWSGAYVCKSFRNLQPGTYQITAVVPLRGKLYVDRTFVAGFAHSRISVMLKAWQGTYPGNDGHRFRFVIRDIRKSSGIGSIGPVTINDSYTVRQNYNVVNTTPLKVCAGQESLAEVRAYGRAYSDFYYVSARDAAPSEVVIDLQPVR